MKLLYCNNCEDIIRVYDTTSTCRCGESGGHYKEDGFNIVVYGPCKPIGIENESFSSAVENQNEYGYGQEFTAFVIPKVCPTVDHVASEDYEEYTAAKYYDRAEELTAQLDLDIINKKKIKNVFKDEK
jgi:hypothetical protein